MGFGEREDGVYRPKELSARLLRLRFARCQWKRPWGPSLDLVHRDSRASICSFRALNLTSTVLLRSTEGHVARGEINSRVKT